VSEPGSRPLPDRGGAGAEYWASAGRRELLLPSCDACRAIFWPARSVCPSCGSGPIGWTRASGRGTIHTFTIVRQTPDPYFKNLVPYVVAMIDLDEGPRVMSNVVGSGAIDVTIGTRVKVQFEVHGEIGIPLFEAELGSSVSR
jgi:uncharacterized OB-fold protein